MTLDVGTSRTCKVTCIVKLLQYVNIISITTENCDFMFSAMGNERAFLSTIFGTVGFVSFSPT